MRKPLLAAACALALAWPGFAWHTTGHAKVARAAVSALPETVPEFFRAGAHAIGEASVDPDLWKHRATPRLRAAEYPEHFLDWELIGGAALPEDRYDLIALAQQHRLAPDALGFLPYAIAEGTEKLTLAFAEHRRFPQDAAIRQKALVYAGRVAHYIGDLGQPLHTTVHYDGRVPPGGSSPRSGIHNLVDGLFERAPLDARALTRDLPVRELADPWAAIQAELAASHALVDEVYRLEPQLRQAAQSGGYPPEVVRFAGDRFRSTAAFMASLYWTAWQRSAAIELPEWLERPPADRAEVVLTPR